MLTYSRQSISKDDIKAVVDVLRSDCLTQGLRLPEFEQAVARKVSARYAIAVNSATSALHLACLALELGSGDWLWTSPISFVASANCGIYCGAKVDFVDIDASTGLMSISALTIKLEQAKLDGKLPKILVPVHLAGTSCDMQAIADLANHYEFSVIEDASHAIGGSYAGQPVGSCKYSDITVYSFHPVKIITTGEGGMALTNDSILAQRIDSLRGHGITRTNFELNSPGPWYYEQQELGYNYRMTEFQAALGLSQLKKLDKFVESRQKLMKFYRDAIQDWQSIEFLVEPKNVYSSYHLAVLRLYNASPEQHRKLFEWMRANGIWVQLHYWPIHLNPYYRRLGFVQGQFPFAEHYALSSFSIPLFPGLTNHQQCEVLRILQEGLASAGML